MRGRSSRVPDPTADRLRLIADAQREAEQRQAAVAELALTGSLHGAAISPAARDLLLDLVAALLAQQGEEITDRDAGLRLRAVPGPDTVVTSPDGTTTFVSLSLTVSGLADSPVIEDAGDLGAEATGWPPARREAAL